MSESRESNEQEADYAQPTLTVSIAAEIAGMHAQTLRTYDRLGLVVPARTTGRGRRYSRADVDALVEIQQLSLEGISLEGIRRILELKRKVHVLEEALAKVRSASEHAARFFAATADGDVEPLPLGRRPARPSSGSSSSASSPGNSEATADGCGAVVPWTDGE